ncbi:SEC-C domain-containing protein (plasmid) [Agrobacterium larrymoorei]|uniref:SEC-C domain-containing protein n=2 Tax=Agrobacterium larrymoorei TaxID=160699 RepID=A0A4D7DVS0_9HYPH|nr:hypothetical protein CFBP5473_23010 [Agrobacterium larrymoorei]QYA10428.1 SEC-C domain-containing protein [Agrobacterium larrymoorei]
MQGSVDAALPRPAEDISGAIQQCATLAGDLPFGQLTPEILVWKLAGAVALASAGYPPRADHIFRRTELPQLFDQLAVQLQDFPAPPRTYWAQENEPPLSSTAQVRIVIGYSGAGKTAWVAQAALHSTSPAVYYDVSDTPGQSLASSLARELAATLFGNQRGGLGDVLMPGASGIEILRRISERLARDGMDITLVLDNAHRLEPSDIHAVVKPLTAIKFVLLSHPGPQVAELEALVGGAAEPLRGWGIDTVAAASNAGGCVADVAACQRLLRLTGGFPLYVLNAVSIAAQEYAGSIRELCDSLESQTHLVETAQELILKRVLLALSAKNREVLSVLSLSDIPLTRLEVTSLLASATGIDAVGATQALRQLRTSGSLEIYAGDRLKVHDALRLVGLSYLTDTGEDKLLSARTALKDVLFDTINDQFDLQRFGLYLRTLAAVGDIKPLVELATDELFHEIGVWSDVHPFLVHAASSEETAPEDRFWAFDGLVFGAMKRSDYASARRYVDGMSQLIDVYTFGEEERLAEAMKRMNIAAAERDSAAVIKLIASIDDSLPDSSAHRRIFRYNAANALYFLQAYDATISETEELASEYFGLLGIRATDLDFRNRDKIWPLLVKSETLVDDLKHLADTLDLHAKAINAIGRDAGRARLNAMKLYELAQAPDSLIRLGQDFVDECIKRHEYDTARSLIETSLLPNVIHLKMASKLVPVRAQYAEVLALCGDLFAADREMAKLAPYEAGLEADVLRDVEYHRRRISEMRVRASSRQRLRPEPSLSLPKKVGRNDPCPCGSGKKYKKCHGAA